MAVAVSALLVLSMIVGSYQHGMLWDPVNRASAWRKGFDTPANYDDNQLWCGGRQTQWNSHGGKCGMCGDNYGDATPRAHENGGKYGTGTIVQSYESGSVITTTTRITANHWGTFLYNLCVLDYKGQPETEECFEKYPLKLAGGQTQYTLRSSSVGDYKVQLVLPQGVKCNHCVLQWTYVTANSWGICSNGTGAVGCGPQENFRTCSDISIY